jgi:hypothetical protein
VEVRSWSLILTGEKYWQAAVGLNDSITYLNMRLLISACVLQKCTTATWSKLRKKPLTLGLIMLKVVSWKTRWTGGLYINQLFSVSYRGYVVMTAMRRDGNKWYKMNIDYTQVLSQLQTVTAQETKVNVRINSTHADTRSRDFLNVSCISSKSVCSVYTGESRIKGWYV